MDVVCQELKIYKNPYKLPINELHLEVTKLVKGKETLSRFLTPEEFSKQDFSKYYQKKTVAIPALDKSWISREKPYNNYQEYYGEFSKEDNSLFIERNVAFSETLQELLDYDYHQFWCHILFEPKICVVLTHFVLNPIYWYELHNLDDVYCQVYNIVFDKVLKVYERMLRFKESETEYIAEEIAMKYLCERNYFNTPIIMSLSLLYSKVNGNFIERLINAYYTEQMKPIYSKEIKRFIDHVSLALEMIGGHLCGFEEGAKIVPVGVRPKPDYFDPYWIEEVVAYLLDTFASLHLFLPHFKPVIEQALDAGLPHRISYFYERVYIKLYETLEDRSQLPAEWPRLEKRILENIAFGRSEAVNTFNTFVSHCLDQITLLHGQLEEQEKHVEVYINLLTNALEDEKFFFDYNCIYAVKYQIEMINDICPNLDRTRTDYILVCASNLSKLQALNEGNIFKTKPGTSQQKKKEAFSMEYGGASTSASVKTTNRVDYGEACSSTALNEKFNERQIDESIDQVLEALPHLGDGFVLQCLEHYDYNPTAVISAVLDNNLPPHLTEIPFDTIRIPEEPEPEKPILAYKGKRTDYRDTNELLNDKSKDIKDFVIKACNTQYDPYDDEYDDREDLTDYKVLEENDEEGVYRHMKDRFDGVELVSDPSESSSDEEPAPDQNMQNGKKTNFCEDPALVRERREALRRGRGGARGRDVVGRPKGQGQDKNVQQNREKKNVNKSSRANHNRKGGAQWKRSRGMFS